MKTAANMSFMAIRLMAKAIRSKAMNSPARTAIRRWRNSMAVSR